MTATYSFVENDTASKLEVTCIDNDSGNAIPLTGKTVTLRWSDRRGEPIARVMTITDAANGVAEYQFAAGELDQPSMQFEVQITNADSTIMKSLDVLVEKVRKELS